MKNVSRPEPEEMRNVILCTGTEYSVQYRYHTGTVRYGRSTTVRTYVPGYSIIQYMITMVSAIMCNVNVVVEYGNI